MARQLLNMLLAWSGNAHGQAWRLKVGKCWEWYARADEEVKDLVSQLQDNDVRTMLVSTEGLGAGKPFVPFRTVISSREVNRRLPEHMMGV